MNIKIVDGKFLMKDGKAVTNPACCCYGCCLYPSKDTTSPTAYPFTDLPSPLDITLGGVLYAGATKQDVGGGVWRYVHPDYEGGTVPLIRTELGNGWFYGDDGGLGSSGCLIDTLPGGEESVADLFPDELNVTVEVGGESPFTCTTTLYRGLVPDQELCMWSGASGCPGQNFDEGFSIRYGSENDAYPYKWQFVTAPVFPTIAAVVGGVKTGDQDTPIGTYSTSGIITSITVS